MFECPKHRTLPLINTLITFANLMSGLLASKKISLKPANSSVTLTKMLTDGQSFGDPQQLISVSLSSIRGELHWLINSYRNPFTNFYSLRVNSCGHFLLSIVRVSRKNQSKLSKMMWQRRDVLSQGKRTHWAVCLCFFFLSCRKSKFWLWFLFLFCSSFCVRLDVIESTLLICRYVILTCWRFQ